jgi:hypothetical protein
MKIEKGKTFSLYEVYSGWVGVPSKPWRVRPCFRVFSDGSAVNCGFLFVENWLKYPALPGKIQHCMLDILENDDLMISHRLPILNVAKWARISFPFQLFFCFGTLILSLWEIPLANAFNPDLSGTNLSVPSKSHSHREEFSPDPIPILVKRKILIPILVPEPL